ncbi:MAG: 2-dehydropantoate 2-reductase [Deltaproteobacteria bacterium]|nr:2-dehydropantoate 2-reductase [Deltaproteobacteria bacterium]
MNSTTRPHICIVGAGALGLGLAAHLSKECNVSVLCRSNKAEQLRSGQDVAGLSYITSLGALPLDLASLWICVKAYDNLAALKTVEPLLRTDCPIVLLSNGLGVFMECAEFISRRAPIVRALVNTGFLETLDAVVQSGPLLVTLAAPKEHSASLDSIDTLLQKVGAHVTRESDVARAEWKKTFINAPVNSLCSIVRAPNRAITENPLLRSQAEAVIAEVRAVAAAEGFDFSDFSTEEILRSIAAHGENRNSNLIDLERGRPTQIDYILGRLIRIAKSYDVPTPHSETLYALCKALEKPGAPASKG